MTQRILVPGAAGKVGRPLATPLPARRATIRGLVRRGSAVAGTLPPAAERVAGDLACGASLPGALRGQDARCPRLPGHPDAGPARVPPNRTSWRGQ